MKITRVVLRLSMILAALGFVLGLAGVSLIGVSIVYNMSQSTAIGDGTTLSNPVQFQNQVDEVAVTGRNRRNLPTLTPTPQETTTRPTPTSILANSSPIEEDNFLGEGLSGENEENGIDAAEVKSKMALIAETTLVTTTETPTEDIKPSIVTSTKAISSSDISTDVESEPTQQVEVDAEEDIEYVEPYTSTDQVQPPPSASSELEEEVALVCPTTSEAIFDLIPIEGRSLSGHPDFMHADLNLSLRGYTPVY